jgi:hypothetical protein
MLPLQMAHPWIGLNPRFQLHADIFSGNEQALLELDNGASP